MSVLEARETTSWIAGPHRRPAPRLEAPPTEATDIIARAAIAVIAVGVAWRIIRYALAFPIWGDEAMFCLNLMSRDIDTILNPLENGQVAPALFVLGEWLCYQFMGPSEYSLRLLPLLAGLLSIPLFWMLARTLLPKRTALLAVALLAVSHWPVAMSALVKPYSGDLFWSLLLLLPASKLLRRPDALGWWLFLIGATPLALLGSFPAAFVAAGVGLCLTILACRVRTLRVWLLLTLLAATTLAAFAFNYLQVIARTRAETQDYMQWYWQSGFPPAHPVAFALWFLKAHVGQAFAYPLGSANGGSILTFLAVLAGAVVLWRGGRRGTLLLCLAPFAFSFLAAVINRYPYGDSCRLAQHLAPSICLLAAVGLNRVLGDAQGRLSTRVGSAGFLLLAAVGLAGLLRDTLRPYRGAGDVWNRQVIREVFRHVDPADRVIVHVRTDTFSAAFRWYLLHQSAAIELLDDLDPQTMSKADAAKTWCLDLAFCLQGDDAPVADCEAINRLRQAIAKGDSVMRHHVVQRYAHIERGDKRELIQFCAVHLWCRESSAPLLAGAAP